MARTDDRLEGNAPGDFFVDRSCIDCRTCRIVAPSIFRHSAAHGASVVHTQPADEASRTRALMALVSCPTHSIGSVSKRDPREAARSFPERIDGDVYHCGNAAESSYGAQSYLIVRKEGNVLVDSPRFTPALAERIAALGGVRTMFLSHRDDVADHAKLARHFGCERVLHEEDVTHDTASVERKLRGQAPIALAPDLLAIPVPGHTRGSVVLLFADRYLFAGDHLLWSEPDPVTGAAPRLYASRRVCWYSWSEQAASVARLLDFTFQWVLPGHSAWDRAESPAAMRESIARLARDMRG